MRILVLGFILFITRQGIAQTDSAVIEYSYIEDENLVLINQLNNVQLVNIACRDTSLRGKRFFLYIDEYRDGKKEKQYAPVSDCETIRIPVPMGRDTAYYVMDPCDDITFKKHYDEQTIRFAGKFDDGEFRILIRYRPFAQEYTLKGESNYSLRPVHGTPDGTLTIPLGEHIPILTYTPPFKIGGGLSSYCLLGEEEEDEWYEKFGVSHYYVFYLEID